MTASRLSFCLSAATVLLAAGWLLQLDRSPPSPRTLPPTVAFARPEIFQPPPDANERALRAAALSASFARDVELAAILEEVAASDRETAGELLLSLPEADRRRAAAAVLLDAARHPQAASQLAADFCRLDPEAARDHGYALIAALTRAGEIDAALRFVAAQSAEAGESENPHKWLKAVYAAWAEQQPAAAVAQAAALPDDAAREEALASALKKWGGVDPAAATGFVLQLPPSSARNAALGRAAEAWAEKNPADAARWLAGVPSSPEFDRAAAIIAADPLILSSDPIAALNWAERIVTPALRTRTLAAVVTRLSARDPGAALNYLERASLLSLDDRAQLLAKIAPPPD